MTTSLARGAVRGLATVLLVAATVTAGATAAQAAPVLSVSALSFAEPTVDATGGAADKLSFTVTDTDPAVAQTSGTFTVRMRSTVTGGFLGRAYSYDFSSGNYCCGPVHWVDGEAQEAHFEWTFGVPSYSDATTAVWAVTQMTLADTKNRKVTVGAAKLAAFASSFTATTKTDTSGPVADNYITLYQNRSPVRPYVYLGGGDRTVTYEFSVQDLESGFWKGSIKLAGPGGQSVTTSFVREQESYGSGLRCGLTAGGDDVGTYADCTIVSTLPVDAKAGVWRLAQLVVINNAGARTTVKSPAAPAVTATTDDGLQASGFAITPDPVDTWRTEVHGEVTMTVAGARKGVSQAYVDVDGSCTQWGAVSTSADGKVHIPIYYYWNGGGDCTITGIALVDGTGAVALYGPAYQAPDPHLTAHRLPDTTPPVVTGASLNPATLPASEATGWPVTLTVHAQVLTAPIDNYELHLYNSDGDEVWQQSGGTSQAADGTVTISVSLPWSGLQPGTYTVGFVLGDEGRLFTSWGVLRDPDSKPVPGGPLTLTVTEG